MRPVYCRCLSCWIFSLPLSPPSPSPFAASFSEPLVDLWIAASATLLIANNSVTDRILSLFAQHLVDRMLGQFTPRQSRQQTVLQYTLFNTLHVHIPSLPSSATFVTLSVPVASTACFFFLLLAVCLGTGVSELSFPPPLLAGGCSVLPVGFFCKVTAAGSMAALLFCEDGLGLPSTCIQSKERNIQPLIGGKPNKFQLEHSLIKNVQHNYVQTMKFVCGGYIDELENKFLLACRLCARAFFCYTCFGFPLLLPALGLLVCVGPELGRSVVCWYSALRFGCSRLAPLMDT